MKIILESDSRFKYLDQIYSKYDYYNILEEYPDDYPYIIIPQLLTINPIEDSEYNASFSDKDGYVYSRSYAARHVTKYTGLTIQELFDLCVLHINDTNDRPKCHNCGKYIKWSGRITAGYGSGGHRWDESEYHFCSRECASRFQYDNLDKYPNCKKFIEEGGTFGLMIANPEDYNWNRTLIKSRRTNFIQNGGLDDECYFYVTWTSDGYFKFGASEDINQRKSYSGFIDQYISCHLIHTSTRLKIGNLEALIKLKLNINNEYIEESEVPTFWKYFRELRSKF